MNKNKFLLVISTLLFAVLFNSCKKYPEGGFVYQTNKHLFGGNKVGDSKTWKLKYYEVNGIDSTAVIPGANSIPDFYNKFITFTYFSKGDPSVGYTASSFLYDYKGKIGKAYNQMTVGFPYESLTKEDSAQCRTIGNNLYCIRNILFPEFDNYAKLWNIKKLTQNEIILEMNLKNFYKITLSQ